MTALNLASATTRLAVPSEPFTQLSYGPYTFGAPSGAPLSTPHPVRVVDGIPGIPRRSGTAGVASLRSGPEPISSPLYGATFVAFRGAFGESSSYSPPAVQMCYYTSGIKRGQIAYASVHDQTVIDQDEPLDLSIPHTEDGLSVYAWVNSSTEAFVANSLQGVLASVPSISAVPGPLNTGIDVTYTFDLDVLGIWHFADVQVSQQDAVDTMAAILAELESGGGPSGPSTVGEAYRAAVVQAVLGPAASGVIPSVLWGAWLDDDLTVLAETGIEVLQSAFGPTASGVENTAIIDAGVCPSTIPAHFALMDAESGGQVVVYAPVTFASVPAPDDPLVFAPGELVFEYGA